MSAQEQTRVLRFAYTTVLSKTIWRTASFRSAWSSLMSEVSGTGLQAELLARRLGSLWDLNDEEKHHLRGLAVAPELVCKGPDIVREGAAPTVVKVLLDGAACRYKILPDGQRQIIGFVHPGDLVNPFNPVDTVSDHAVGALTRCLVARVAHDVLRELMAAYPNIASALWCFCVAQSAAFQTWLANTRRRSACQRLAHLFCEQFVRLEAVGLAEHGRPVTPNIAQADLADAAAMSAVHVNRTLQLLRNQRLVGRDPNSLEILDWPGLQELAAFDPTYLHLRRDRGRFENGRTRVHTLGSMAAAGFR
jgi:CRP-like cAMP-binding protein